jgi:hypothetical protein
VGGGDGGSGGGSGGLGGGAGSGGCGSGGSGASAGPTMLEIDRMDDNYPPRGRSDAGDGPRSAIPSSRSWASPTGAGAPVSGSVPEADLGKAITSRIESAPWAMATIRSMP